MLLCKMSAAIQFANLHSVKCHSRGRFSCGVSKIWFQFRNIFSVKMKPISGNKSTKINKCFLYSVQDDAIEFRNLKLWSSSNASGEWNQMQFCAAVFFRSKVISLKPIFLFSCMCILFQTFFIIRPKMILFCFVENNGENIWII